MNEDFAPYALAVKLKEKGFKEKCIAYYDVNDNVELLYNTQYTDYMLPCQYTDLLQSHNTGEAEKQPDDSEYCADAPTISQVLKWMRENYSLHISTKPYPCEDGLMWLYEIRKFSKYISSVVANKTGFIKEELAALAGIEYVINNLI